MVFANPVTYYITIYLFELMTISGEEFHSLITEGKKENK